MKLCRRCKGLTDRWATNPAANITPEQGGGQAERRWGRDPGAKQDHANFSQWWCGDSALCTQSSNQCRPAALAVKLQPPGIQLQRPGKIQLLLQLQGGFWDPPPPSMSLWRSLQTCAQSSNMFICSGFPILAFNSFIYQSKMWSREEAIKDGCHFILWHRSLSWPWRPSVGPHHLFPFLGSATRQLEIHSLAPDGWEPVVGLWYETAAKSTWPTMFTAGAAWPSTLLSAQEIHVRASYALCFLARVRIWHETVLMCPQKMRVVFCAMKAFCLLTFQTSLLLRNYSLPLQKVRLETEEWEETFSNSISNQIFQTREHHFRERRLSIGVKGLPIWEASYCILLRYFRLPLSSKPGLLCLSLAFASGFVQDLYILWFLYASSGKQSYTRWLIFHCIICCPTLLLHM